MSEREIHCWAGRREEIEETYGYDSEAYMETYAQDWKGGIRLLPDGHGGPHVFTDTDQIMIRFVDPWEPPRSGEAE